ncbi:hypothetical protein B0H14DRAFT_3863665 [Mycena olivaceomarginata]|nr:hypothetical protein B0H14DRAFT_3863665 [Mycena olivaceomarginata]
MNPGSGDRTRDDPNAQGRARRAAGGLRCGWGVDCDDANGAHEPGTGMIRADGEPGVVGGVWWDVGCSLPAQTDRDNDKLAARRAGSRGRKRCRASLPPSASHVRIHVLLTPYPPPLAPILTRAGGLRPRQAALKTQVDMDIEASAASNAQPYFERAPSAEEKEEGWREGAVSSYIASRAFRLSIRYRHRRACMPPLITTMRCRGEIKSPPRLRVRGALSPTKSTSLQAHLLYCTPRAAAYRPHLRAAFNDTTSVGQPSADESQKEKEGTYDYTPPCASRYLTEYTSLCPLFRLSSYSRAPVPVPSDSPLRPVHVRPHLRPNLPSSHPRLPSLAPRPVFGSSPSDLSISLPHLTLALPFFRSSAA